MTLQPYGLTKRPGHECYSIMISIHTHIEWVSYVDRNASLRTELSRWANQKYGLELDYVAMLLNGCHGVRTTKLKLSWPPILLIRRQLRV